MESKEAVEVKTPIPKKEKVKEPKPSKRKVIDLPEQRLADLDPTQLTALTPIVMNRQATINIGS